jgi:hypothetical protein
VTSSRPPSCSADSRAAPDRPPAPTLVAGLDGRFQPRQGDLPQRAVRHERFPMCSKDRSAASRYTPFANFVPLVGYGGSKAQLHGRDRVVPLVGLAAMGVLLAGVWIADKGSIPSLSLLGPPHRPRPPPWPTGEVWPRAPDIRGQDLRVSDAIGPSLSIRHGRIRLVGGERCRASETLPRRRAPA